MKQYNKEMKITVEDAVSVVVEHYFDVERKHFKEYNGKNKQKHVFPYLLALKGYLEIGLLDGV